MQADIQQAINEKAEKIRRNVICDLEEYYGDPEEWNDASMDLVKYGIFYSDSCNQLLKAALLYGYEVEPFARKLLAEEPKIEIDEKNLQRHHYILLFKYFLDRALIQLFIDKTIDSSSLKNASEYHLKTLEAYGYSSESDVLEELDADTLLSYFVPQMIVKMLLNVDYSYFVLKSNIVDKSDENIWICAWRFLCAISNNDNEVEIECCWGELVNAWKICFLNSNFHAFSNTNFVCIYYLFCRTVGRQFSVKDIFHQIVTN